jgi:hypothetical protein
VPVSNELKYEIAPTPIRYGQSQAALAQSSEGRSSGGLVAEETPSLAAGADLYCVSKQPGHANKGDLRSGICVSSIGREPDMQCGVWTLSLAVARRSDDL